MDTKTAAAILGVSPRTLEAWRCKKVGPDYIVVNGVIRYPMLALTDWLAKHAVVHGEAA